MVSMDERTSYIGVAPPGGGKPVHTFGGATSQSTGRGSGGRQTSQAGSSSEEWPLNVTGAKQYSAVRIKGQGLTDDLRVANELVRETIRSMSEEINQHQSLLLKVAETEADQADALKLYRDMNHLSLAGGITCESVINHVQSHTVNLYFITEDEDAEPILVTAATFSMRNQTMMLRLLATHPRMTRRGFARVTVHFLKELCRTLRKTDILVYTYPSSSPFYKALNFRHTNPDLAKPKPTAPATDSAADAAAARAATQDARRVYSAKENEMICYIQPSMEQILDDSLKAVAAHPYACTRRRAGAAATEQPTRAPAAAPAPASQSQSSSREKKAPARAPPPAPEPPKAQQRPRPPPRERVIAPPRGHASAPAAIGLPLMGPDGTPASGSARRASRGRAPEKSADGDGHDASDDTAPIEEDGDDDQPAQRNKRRLEKNEYHVERIVGVRSNGGEMQYLIKWKGWQSKFNTWEPVHHLKNLQSEIEAFEGSLKVAKFS